MPRSPLMLARRRLATPSTSSSTHRSTAISCPGRPALRPTDRPMPSTQAEAVIAVRAPATSANLGPGFDCLGLALDLWSEVVARPGRATAGTALIARAVQAVFDRVGKAPPELAFECVNRIPFSRGLGSSAAAIVSG